MYAGVYVLVGAVIGLVGGYLYAAARGWDSIPLLAKQKYAFAWFFNCLGLGLILLGIGLEDFVSAKWPWFTASAIFGVGFTLFNCARYLKARKRWNTYFNAMRGETR